MNDDNLLIEKNFSRLRDCFYAGYTLPQFCIDRGIKKPIFLSPANLNPQILWEIYVQFAWDKCVQPIFVTLEEKSFELQDFSLPWFLSSPTVKSISEFDMTDSDKIFFLSMNHLEEFDGIIYLDELIEIFTFHVYFVIPLSSFAQRHPDVKIFAMNFPRLKVNPNNSEREKILLRDGDKPLEEIRENFSADYKTHIATPFDFLGYSNEKVHELLKTPTVKTKPDGSTFLVDDGNKYLAIRTGKRLTANQPETFANRIFILGNCIYFGRGVPFYKTLASCLQQLLNENNLPWRVENESQFFGGRNQDVFYRKRAAKAPCFSYGDEAIRLMLSD